MNSTQIPEGSREAKFAKEQIDLMLRTRIREELEEFCLINIFSAFGYDPLVFAAFGIDVKEVLFEEMDTIKNKLKEVSYEIKE